MHAEPGVCFRKDCMSIGHSSMCFELRTDADIHLCWIPQLAVETGIAVLPLVAKLEHLVDSAERGQGYELIAVQVRVVRKSSATLSNHFQFFPVITELVPRECKKTGTDGALRGAELHSVGRYSIENLDRFPGTKQLDRHDCEKHAERNRSRCSGDDAPSCVE